MSGSKLRNEDLLFNINKLENHLNSKNVILSDLLKYEHGIYTNFERYLKVKWADDKALLWLGTESEQAPVGFEVQELELKDLKLAKKVN